MRGREEIEWEGLLTSLYYCLPGYSCNRLGRETWEKKVRSIRRTRRPNRQALISGEVFEISDSVCVSYERRLRSFVVLVHHPGDGYIKERSLHFALRECV